MRNGGKFRSENPSSCDSASDAAGRQSVQSQIVLAWYLQPPSLCNDEGLLDVSSWPFTHVYPSNIEQTPFSNNLKVEYDLYFSYPSHNVVPTVGPQE